MSTIYRRHLNVDPNVGSLAYYTPYRYRGLVDLVESLDGVANFLCLQ